MKRFFLILSLTCLIWSCSQTDRAVYSSDNDSTKKEKPSYLSNFTKEDVAKYTVAAIMNHPPDIMEVIKDGEDFVVSYVRKDDGQTFKLKVKIDENKIMWGNLDGRWRDNELDEKITFTENGNKLKIIETYTDGTSTVKEYEKIK